MPATGNIYLQKVDEAIRFPATFTEAIDRFGNSAVARDLFGGAFVDFFAQSRASQQADFDRLVTDTELQRFFELI
ncbi:MAG: hypothetical protein HOL02_21385 [Rhodospirillaceae bacterium]|nr:hypothetical protein [Rhodospirillaceae bacterium]MBT7615467.1 hypothetical protein [Rhodospirillaceae bacterium]MBT7649222.1 hypothetical protein [Rhodospirillaceae bacterium]